MDFHLDTLLSLPNITVESCTYQSEQVNLKLQFLIEKSDYPYCHKSSEELHQKRPMLIRDLAIFGRLVYLHVPRRQFYCDECQRYFTERLTFADWERRSTQRCEDYVYQRVQSTSIEQVSREENLSWDQFQGIFKYNFSKKTTWTQVKRLSIDIECCRGEYPPDKLSEVSQRKGHQDFVTVVADIDQGKLLEVIDSHQQKDIIEVLKQQPLELREQVKVSVDMWGGFPKVVQTVFPNALLVFDRFHVMQPVNKELNKVRKQTETSVKGSKFILLKNGVDLTESERVKLEVILSSSQRLWLAYNFEAELREIFETCKTVESGKGRLLDWLRKAHSVYGDILTTIRNHLDGICNHSLSQTTSGVMEGINNRIKLIKRQGYGFVNFDNFRSRLLACFSN